jgi:hypothetical protein
MSHSTIPTPSRATLDLFDALERGLAAFTEARTRRERAESTVKSERFCLKTLTEEQPSNNLRMQAEHEAAIKAAQSRIDAAVAEFLAAEGRRAARGRGASRVSGRKQGGASGA